MIKFFSQDNIPVILRRITVIATTVCSCVCLALQLFGFISYRGRPLSVISALNNLFEFVNYGKASFWECTLYIAVSVLYFIVAIKALFAIIDSLRNIKNCIEPKINNRSVKDISNRIVRSNNTVLRQFILLYITSYIISAFSIALSSVLVIAGLIFTNVLINIGNNLTQGRKLIFSISSATKYGLLLASVIMFAVMSQKIQLIDLYQACLHLINTINMGVASDGFVVLMFYQSILNPLFHLIMLIVLIHVSKKVSDVTWKAEQYAKRLLIMNAILLGIMMILLGYVNTYTTINDYLSIINANIFFVLITAMVGICLYNNPNEA